jgi:hypothetical protein
MDISQNKVQFLTSKKQKFMLVKKIGKMQLLVKPVLLICWLKLVIIKQNMLLNSTNNFQHFMKN